MKKIKYEPGLTKKSLCTLLILLILLHYMSMNILPKV